MASVWQHREEFREAQATLLKQEAEDSIGHSDVAWLEAVDLPRC